MTNKCYKVVNGVEFHKLNNDIYSCVALSMVDVGMTVVNKDGLWTVNWASYGPQSPDDTRIFLHRLSAAVMLASELSLGLND